MNPAVLRTALDRTLPWVRRSHAGWWRSWEPSSGGAEPRSASRSLRDRAGTQPSAQARLTQLPVRTVALAPSKAADGFESESLLAARLEDLLHQHARARDVVACVHDPRTALAAYLVAAAVLDPNGSAGDRVFLEDLGEALLMPPTLIRHLDAVHRSLQTPTPTHFARCG